MTFFNRRTAALLLAAALPMISQASVTVGTGDPGTGNCFPFGCGYGGDYQQVYGSTQFSGPITIGALDFYNTKFDSGATTMNSGTWTISLSTTSAGVNGLGTPGSTNLGADNTLVFSGNLSQPWTFGDTLHIDLSHAFTYNPASGNLLMDIEVSGSSDAGGDLFFDMQKDSGVMSREFYGTTDGWGLVTTFESGSVSTVPEPASGVLLVAGLGLVAGLSQRRRSAKAAAAI
jgi:hypothetical protein